MVRQEFIEKLYEAASIQRWNDHIRPVELTELDKQAHKMVIAYVIAKFEESTRAQAIDWIKLIEGGIFELLQRVILTDIKPPVFHKMIAEKGRELNDHVLKQLERDLRSAEGGLWDSIRRYFEDPDYARVEKRILKAAHYLATNWEFKIIYNVAPFIYGIEKTKAEIENEIEDHYDLIGVQKITLGKKSYGFIDLCGQLRFQQRWAQTPRIPKTSVLGHMLIVAVLSYLSSIALSACTKRRYNDFYGALFHDLAEVLTRDIVSPVKRSVAGLDRIIKEYEKLQVDEKLLPLLPSTWHREIRDFVEGEFENKVVEDGRVVTGKSIDEINARYNEDRFSPKDGEVIKICDDLAAFIEASLSIRRGMKSEKLEGARNELYAKYKDRTVGGVPFGTLFAYFK